MSEYLRAVPPVVWSGALGALIALIGVLISNREGRKRLALQLEHDLSLKREERNSQWRREVYSDLLKAIRVVAERLGLSITEAQSERLKDSVGDAFEELAFQVVRCASISSVAIVEIAGSIEQKLRRFDLDHREQIRIAQKLRDRIAESLKSAKSARRTQRQLLDEHWQLRIPPLSPSKREQILVWIERFERNEKESSAIRELLDELYSSYFEKSLDLLEKLDQVRADVATLRGRLILEVRRELGLSVEGYAEWIDIQIPTNFSIAREESVWLRKSILGSSAGLSERSQELSQGALEIEQIAKGEQPKSV